MWKPTRRGRKDPPATSQYITTRLGVCPVVIGPHIFPDTRFLSVRKVDEKAEKAEKAAKTAPTPKPPAPAPIPTPTQTPATGSNALTVKALTEIAATSPEFSAILQAVANKTATPEQHAALAQYMRAASLFGTSKSSLMANPTTPTPKPLATPTPVQNISPVPPVMPKPITPVTTIPKTPITTIPPPSASPPRTPLQMTQSAPIPPVPKSNPHAPTPAPITPRLIATPVTRIPPPSGNLNPIPLPNLNRPPVTTPITRIPPPSTPLNPPKPLNLSPPLNPVPLKPATPVTITPQPVTPATPVTTGQSISGPSLTTPSALQSTPLSLQTDPMNFVEIGFELTEPGERLLIPRHTILEKFVSPQGGNHVLASFILTINNNSVYIPITLKLSDCPPRIWDTLYKYVHPQQVVVKEMEKIMKECKRFEKSILQLRIPLEEEGFSWNGIKKETERKKYQRKKKEEVKEEDGADVPSKKKKSLVVGLKYTPTKKEPEPESL